MTQDAKFLNTDLIIPLYATTPNLTFVGKVYAEIHGETEHGHDETQQREEHPVLAELSKRVPPHDLQGRADLPAVPTELFVVVAVHGWRPDVVRFFDIVAEFLRVASIHLCHKRKKKEKKPP